MKVVSKDDLKRSLHKLKVKQDALLMVHSSLSRFGYFEGGAEAVITALLAVVSDGTVVMPTYTRYLPDPSEFDPIGSPSDCGTIAERFRLRPNVIRQSNNPRHSVAVWGRYQRELLDTLETRPYRTYDFFIEHGGQVLLIGVGYEAHSFIHSMLDEAPRLGALDTGIRVKSMLFPRLEPWLECSGAQRSTQCGNSRLRLIDVLKARDAVHQALRECPDLFKAPPSEVEKSYRIGKVLKKVT